MRTLLIGIIRFFERKFISIRIKFTLSMVVAIMVFGAINFGISYAFVMKTAQEEIDQKVELLANVFTKRLGGFLDVRDYPSAESLVRDSKVGDHEILYIAVYGPEGKLVVHSFAGKPVPAYMIRAETGGFPKQFIDNENHLSIRTLTYPIENGRLGNLVFGINEEIASGRAKRFGYTMISMTLFFMLLGIAGSMVFSYFISAPIYKILKGFNEFVPGGPMPNVRIGMNDELRLLSLGFESMMERINEIDRNYKSTQMKILETERLASMGTLATGLAHEINNPIAGIQMCLRRVQKSQNLDPRQTEYLLLISEATNHIKGVVQDLLSYAQESDKEKVATDLRTVVTDAAKLVHPRLNRNNIHFHVMVPSGPCSILGVKSHLVQVIVNGIINSIDAIGDGGNIWVTLRSLEKGFFITVEDDGHGLTPEIAAKAFEPFFTTKGKKGTGLGLYVSFGIILAHHGRIELKDRTSGRGSVLAIDLPIERAHEYSHSRG